MKQHLGLIGLVLAGVVGVLFLLHLGAPHGGTTVVEKILGGSAGPTHTETQEFLANFLVGGGNSHYATSSTATAFTLTTRSIDTDVPFVSWTANQNTTLTTMASTSAPFVSLQAGQSFEQLWYNASTTAAATITFAAGTGVDLQEDEGGTVILNGLETARVTYLKKADTDIAVIVEPYQVGD
jgi:hypothetical protein